MTVLKLTPTLFAALALVACSNSNFGTDKPNQANAQLGTSDVEEEIIEIAPKPTTKSTPKPTATPAASEEKVDLDRNQIVVTAIPIDVPVEPVATPTPLIAIAEPTKPTEVATATPAPSPTASPSPSPTPTPVAKIVPMGSRRDNNGGFCVTQSGSNDGSVGHYLIRCETGRPPFNNVILDVSANWDSDFLPEKSRVLESTLVDFGSSGNLIAHVNQQVVNQGGSGAPNRSILSNLVSDNFVHFILNVQNQCNGPGCNASGYYTIYVKYSLFAQ